VQLGGAWGGGEGSMVRGC
jgi:hypothetical protein